MKPQIAHAVGAALPPEIENPEILGINKEAPHAILMPYASQKEALAARRFDSPFCRSLNGNWKFNWVPSPEQRPTEFYEPDFDLSGWKDIPVPSCWQMQGYGTPAYLCASYMFARDWPHVLSEPPRDWVTYNERDAVGSYRRDFELPSGWNGRRVFVTFGGVDCAFYLWVNGKMVGYSTDSRTPAEFDLTNFVHAGTNSISVQVYRFAASSYIEDQDMWFLSGIYRDVYLWSAPNVHIRDFFANPDLDSEYRDATLSVKAKVRNYGDQPEPPRTLQVAVHDAAGKEVARGTADVPALGPAEEGAVEARVGVSNPAKWSAEIPNLYTTVLTLVGADGKALETVSCRTGFRKVELKGRVFCINGVPVKLKGTNRHENWADTGHAETYERKVEDIGLLKRANMNHVRTSHYSDDAQWYELCDEGGIYLNAEANVECHGYYGVLDREPKYRAAMVAHNVANVECYKNHPSVVLWSLGNENGGGDNLKAACAAVRALDTSRPVHYEAFSGGAGNDAPADIDSAMYPSVQTIEQIGSEDRDRAFYMCEYAHAMNNSMGSIGDYNDIVDRYEGLMGGAIWEWQDQAILNSRDPKHEPYLVYGGGFGDKPTDGRFILKGVVDAWHRPNSKYWEAKRVYQWIRFEAGDLAAGGVKVLNRYAFLNLDRFDFSWQVMEDGKVIQHGKLPSMSAAPGSESMVTVPIKPITPRPGAEYTLRLSAALHGKEAWADAGYEMAVGQFMLPVNSLPPAAPSLESFAALAVDDSADSVVMSSAGFRAAFDRKTGALTELSYGGKPVLTADGAPRLNAWRARHHNDDFWASDTWTDLGLDRLTQKADRVQVNRLSSGAVQVSVDGVAACTDGFQFTRQTVYTVLGDGTIAVDEAVESSEPTVVLPRLGVRLFADPALANFAWYGRGPQENYPDRKRGADLGLWDSSVAEQTLPYVQPMEYGNHEDSRWTSLRRADGSGVLFVSESAPFSVAALPYKDEDLAKADYAHDLPVPNSTVLCLSWRTLGVGSNACGPRPLDRYVISAEPATFSWSIRPLSKGADASSVARRTLPARTTPATAAIDDKGLLLLSSSTPGTRIRWATAGAALQPYTGPVKPDGKAIDIAVASDGRLPAPLRRVMLPEGSGGLLSHDGWKIVSASSYEPGEGNPEHAIDGDPSTFWHTRYRPVLAKYPHEIVVDLGKAVRIAGLRYRQRRDMTNGRIKDYQVYLSADGVTWGRAAAKGTFKDRDGRQSIPLPAAVEARYIRVVALSSQDGQDFASIAELDVQQAAE